GLSICIAISAAWFCSIPLVPNHKLFFRHVGDRCEIIIISGTLFCALQDQPADYSGASHTEIGWARPVSPPSCPTSYGSTPWRAERGLVVMPLWIPLLLVAAPTGLPWFRDRRRFPRGHCPSCGYNLTGNESGSCPECGTSCSPPNGASS